MDKLKQLMTKIEARVKARSENENKPNVPTEGRELINNTVTKSNALSRAYYRFGLVEKRVMEALISQLNPQSNPNDLQAIVLKATDYSKIFNVSEKHSYDHLGSAVDALMHRVITVIQPDKIIKMNITTEAIYEKNKGIITVTLSPKIVPHLLGLRSNFTKYPLKISANFKSSYTWRIYELLVSWAENPKFTDGLIAGWCTIKFDELCQMLGVPISYKFNDFDRRVLSVIKAELKQKANIEMEIERIKTGRKVTHLRFTFAEMRQVVPNV